VNVSINSLLNVTDVAIDSYGFEKLIFDCAFFRGILFFPHAAPFLSSSLDFTKNLGTTQFSMKEKGVVPR
jgi:hypothetical protein